MFSVLLLIYKKKIIMSLYALKWPIDYSDLLLISLIVSGKLKTQKVKYLVRVPVLVH